MNDLIVALIDKIKDEAIRGAIFRLYNNTVALIIGFITTLIGAAGVYFVENGLPTTFEELTNIASWEAILVGVIVSQFVASGLKYSREKSSLSGGESSEVSSIG